MNLFDHIRDRIARLPAPPETERLESLTLDWVKGSSAGPTVTAHWRDAPSVFAVAGPSFAFGSSTRLHSTLNFSVVPGYQAIQPGWEVRYALDPGE